MRDENGFFLVDFGPYLFKLKSDERTAVDQLRLSIQAIFRQRRQFGVAADLLNFCLTKCKEKDGFLGRQAAEALKQANAIDASDLLAKISATQDHMRALQRRSGDEENRRLSNWSQVAARDAVMSCAGILEAWCKLKKHLNRCETVKKLYNEEAYANIDKKIKDKLGFVRELRNRVAHQGEMSVDWQKHRQDIGNGNTLMFAGTLSGDVFSFSHKGEALSLPINSETEAVLAEVCELLWETFEDVRYQGAKWFEIFGSEPEPV